MTSFRMLAGVDAAAPEIGNSKRWMLNGLPIEGQTMLE